MQLAEALARTRRWLAWRAKLRAEAMRGPWPCGRAGVYAPSYDRLDSVLVAAAERRDATYIAAVASPDVSAHADAGIAAWCEMVEAMDGVGLFDDVERFCAWASSPLLDVPEVSDAS